MTGVIIKGVGGFYYVRSGDKIYECRARGLFRLKGNTPLVGDEVTFAYHEQGHCYIEGIAERKTVLLRPAVANVTQAAVVISAKSPAPDLLLVDKLIIWAKAKGIEPLLVVNKADQGDAAPVLCQYQGSVGAIAVSALTGHNINELKEKLKGKRTVFAGQSAVGKSTLLNALVPGVSLETGALSKKTERGRHTTRATELIFAQGFELLDTPGFSILEELPVEECCDLSAYYPEFASFNCRFLSCVHVGEPGCGVKEAVSQGDIDTGRYLRYVKLIEEIKEKRARKYD